MYVRGRGGKSKMNCVWEDEGESKNELCVAAKGRGDKTKINCEWGRKNKLCRGRRENKNKL